jgi:hypothetical protein
VTWFVVLCLNQLRYHMPPSRKQVNVDKAMMKSYVKQNKAMFVHYKQEAQKIVCC